MKAFKSVIKRFANGFSRFTLPYIYSAVIFVCVTLVIFNIGEDDSITRIVLSAVSGLLCSSCICVVFDAAANKTVGIILQLISLPVSVIMYLLLNDYGVYCVAAYIGLNIVFLIVGILLVLFNNRKGSADRVFPQLIKTVVFSGAAALLLFAGVELCLAAFNYLIFELDCFEELSFTLLTFSFSPVFICLCLSGIPYGEEDISIPKAFKVIVLYILFPVYILLLAVLYIYCIKFLITGNFHKITPSWFASFAELFYIFFSYTIMQYDDFRPVNFWKRYGGFIMLPIVAVQAAAIAVRVFTYGLTSVRYISIVLSSCALVFIILTVIREGKYKNAAGILLAAVTLAVTVSPANLIDVPVYEQSARLEKTLTEYGLLENGKLVSGVELTNEQIGKIMGSWGEVRLSDKAPDYVKNIRTYSEFNEYFGNYKDPNSYYGNYHYFNFTYPDDFDISEYSFMNHCEMYNNPSDDTADILIEVNGVSYDITDFVRSLDDDSNYSVCEYWPDDNTMLLFNRINFTYTDDSETYFENWDIECLVFRK